MLLFCVVISSYDWSWSLIVSRHKKSLILKTVCHVIVIGFGNYNKSISLNREIKKNNISNVMNKFEKYTSRVGIWQEVILKTNMQKKVTCVNQTIGLNQWRVLN